MRGLVAPVVALLVVAASPGGALAGPGRADASVSGKLFVGGSFASANGTTATNLAAWNGVNWSALTGPNGEGVDQTVSALAVYNGKLIVGGSFIKAGGVTVSGIASWDGTSWSPLVGASGVPGVTVAPLGFVSALAVYNGSLYVGGMFPRAGATTTVNNLARWDGAEWHAVTGPTGFGVTDNGSTIAVVWDMVVHNGTLVIGGEFTDAGGAAANGMAVWNGTAWSSAGQPVADAGVMALAQYNGNVVAARYYTEDNISVYDVAWINNNVWGVLGGRLDGEVRDLATHNGSLVAGGAFTKAGGVTVNYVARWTGSAWAGLSGPSGTGTNGTVYALAVYAGSLVAGGYFSQAGGQPASNIARWSGSAWSSLPAGSAGGVNDTVLELLAA